MSEFEPRPELTPEERLKLLQLQTRDAMAAAARKAVGGGDGNDAADGEGVPDVNGPPHEQENAPWRLVPPGIQLHRWQQECLGIWLANCRGTVKVATGGGKTLFALAAAERLRNERDRELRVVIVVPTIPLMRQWHADLLKSNVSPAAIALLGGGHSELDLNRTRIAICVINSARDQLPRFVAQAEWASHLMLIVDECHRASAEEARKVFEANARYTLGLSATPESESDDVRVPADEAYAVSPVGRALGPIVFEYSLKEALEDGLLAQFEVWHVGVSLDGTEAAQHAKMSREITDLRRSLQDKYRGTRSKAPFLGWCQGLARKAAPGGAEAQRFMGLSNARKRLLYQASARKELVRRVLLASRADHESRVIVFHESIPEIERIFLTALRDEVATVLEHSGLPASVRAENIEAFRSGVARVIVSAKSLVEGFNVPSADLGIIAASSGSVRQRIQSLGRLLRSKEGRRYARVLVLYVRDTQDEEIYSSADWEQVVGAGRNRYFHWAAPEAEAEWTSGLAEQSNAPRVYRPPSSEVLVADLVAGSSYPGRMDGQDLRVDAAGSLRTDDGRMLSASPALIARILELNSYRRAHRTAAGHLVVRIDDEHGRAVEWRYLGDVGAPMESDSADTTRFALKRSRGQRHIAKSEPGGTMYFALGPDRAVIPEAGAARERLLAWVAQCERERGVSLKEILWDGAGTYWVEVQGERVQCSQALAPLEFGA